MNKSSHGYLFRIVDSDGIVYLFLLIMEKPSKEQQAGQIYSSLARKISTYLIIMLAIIIIAVISGGIFLWTKQGKLQNYTTPLNNQPQQTTSTPPATKTEPISDSDQGTRPDLKKIFELDKKESGTMIYYSDKLGVGFTYISDIPNPTTQITESGNQINVYGNTIEVFSKDPKISLEQVIQDRFLQGYDPTHCFVKTYQKTAKEKSSTYISAIISFPPSSDPREPEWVNTYDCPEDYSVTNGVRYFLMNDKVPGKFLFVRVGQDSAFYDGTPQTAGGTFGWSHSLQIIK